MNFTLDQFGPPPAALAPAAHVVARTNLDAVVQGDGDYSAIERALLGWTAAFERACERPLVRRVGITLEIEAADALCARHWGHELDLAPLGPVETVASVHFDAAGDPAGATYDATTLVDPALYRLALRAGERFGTIAFRAGAVRAVGMMRIVVTGGWQPSDGEPGWEPDAGATAVPADLAEALVRQVAADIKYRTKEHLASESVNVAGQVGTSSYITERMRRSVREALAPYATAYGAINLQRGLDDAGGMA